MFRLHQMQSAASRLTVASGLLIVLLLWGTSALAASQKLAAGVPAGNNDHPHNMSSLNTTGNVHANVGETDQICIFCHTPHNAASSRGPLWNRPDITAAFPLYGLLNNIVIDDIAEAKYGGGNEYPNGATRLCLSCHDGVTAVGAVISAWGGSAADSLGPLTVIDNPGMIIDLSSSHPVSFTYDDIGGIVLPLINAKSDLSITSGQYTLPTADILDAEGRMQCTTCHDPHTDTNDGTYLLPMWRKYTGVEANDYDDTCGECHIGGSGSSGLFNPMPLPLPVPIH